MDQASTLIAAVSACACTAGFLAVLSWVRRRADDAARIEAQTRQASDCYHARLERMRRRREWVAGMRRRLQAMPPPRPASPPAPRQSLDPTDVAADVKRSPEQAAAVVRTFLRA